MPVSAAEQSPDKKSVTLRCHRCSQFIGEAAEAVELVAIVKESDLVAIVQEPRATYRCRCGWFNIFKKTLAQPTAA